MRRAGGSAHGTPLAFLGACVRGGAGVSDRSEGGSDDTGREIEMTVVGYLRSHPEAADTLDGIVAWWLPLQRYALEKARIEAALTRLVDAGVLRRDPLPDGEKLYSLVTGTRRTTRGQ